MSDSTRYIAYSTNNYNLHIRPCGMNDIVYMSGKLPTTRNVELMKQRAKVADYDFVVLFDGEKQYSTYGVR